MRRQQINTNNDDVYESDDDKLKALQNGWKMNWNMREIFEYMTWQYIYDANMSLNFLGWRLFAIGMRRELEWEREQSRNVLGQSKNYCWKCRIRTICAKCRFMRLLTKVERIQIILVARKREWIHLKLGIPIKELNICIFISMQTVYVCRCAEPSDRRRERGRGEQVNESSYVVSINFT